MLSFRPRGESCFQVDAFAPSHDAQLHLIARLGCAEKIGQLLKRIKLVVVPLHDHIFRLQPGFFGGASRGSCR